MASAKRHLLDPQAYLTHPLHRLTAITSPLAMCEPIFDHWATTHPAPVMQFWRAESIKAAKRQLTQRERQCTD